MTTSDYKFVKEILMIVLGILALLAITGEVKAIDIDPALTPTKTLVCDYPITREDGSPLALNEIAKVKAYGGTAVGEYNVLAGENTAACRVVIDFSEAVDGTYYYTMTAVDTEGRESGFGVAQEIVVKRIKAPAPPLNLRWED